MEYNLRRNPGNSVEHLTVKSCTKRDCVDMTFSRRILIVNRYLRHYEQDDRDPLSFHHLTLADLFAYYE
jgi:hypothetical protein